MWKRHRNSNKVDLFAAGCGVLLGTAVGLFWYLSTLGEAETGIGGAIWSLEQGLLGRGTVAQAAFIALLLATVAVALPVIRRLSGTHVPS
jgi:hypothetical protein